MPARRRSGRANRSIRPLVVGNAVSSYGTYLNLVALNLFALETTGSALSVGVFLLIRIVSAFLAGFAAGRAVDRVDRKHLMMGCDAVQGLALVTFALSADGTREVLLFGLAAVMGGCSTLSAVARRSSVPDLVGQENRVHANGLLVAGRSVAMVLGFASAGLVVAWSGYTAAFLVDAGSFLLSAAVLLLLPKAALAPRTTASPTTPDSSVPDASTAGELRGKSRWTHALRGYAPVVLCLVLVRAVDNFGSASHQVGLPVFAAEIRPDGAAAFVGQFYAAWAVGCLLSHQCVSRLAPLARLAGRTDDGDTGDRTGRPGGERAFAVGTCLMSAFFILAFTGLPVLALLPVAAAAGLADGFTEIVYYSRLQAVPDEQRGRLLGAAAMTETAALGAGTVLCAWALDRAAPFTVVATSHGTVMVLALALLVLLGTARTLTGRGVRGPTAHAETPRPRVPSG